MKLGFESCSLTLEGAPEGEGAEIPCVPHRHLPIWSKIAIQFHSWTLKARFEFQLLCAEQIAVTIRWNTQCPCECPAGLTFLL